MAIHDLRFRQSRSRPEPLKCPHCGESAGVPLVWGDPDHEKREAARRGEIVLAGCMIEPLGGAVPDYACLSCSYRWRTD